MECAGSDPKTPPVSRLGISTRNGGCMDISALLFILPMMFVLYYFPVLLDFYKDSDVYIMLFNLFLICVLLFLVYCFSFLIKL